MGRKYIVSRKNSRRGPIRAADEMDFDDFDDFEDDGFEDALDDIQDTVDDIQDKVEDIKPDPTRIEVRNNISGHYIAECEECYGIFISATVKSDQRVDSVTGECPLCGNDTTQYLKWYIKPADED